MLGSMVKVRILVWLIKMLGVVNMEDIINLCKQPKIAFVPFASGLCLQKGWI